MSNGMAGMQVADGSVDVRLTPWDERTLGMRTAEITRFSPTSAQNGTLLLEQAEAWCRAHAVRYLFGRFDSGLPHAKQAVLESGHAIVECSLTLSRRGFAGLPSVPARMSPTLREFSDSDLAELQRIATDDFFHGRFLEDPSIDPTQAARRTANWICELARQGQVYTAELNDRIIGFHAERVSADGRHANLILTGATARYAVLGLPLWVVALESLADRGVTSCSTLISAANTDIVNLYAKLGFHYDKTLFGFRKYL